MTHQELYNMLELPAEVVEQLNIYNKNRSFMLEPALLNRLLLRSEWDEALKELQGLLEEDKDGFKLLFEMLDIVCNYSYPKYKEMKISDEIFRETMKFITRFLYWQYEYYGEYD